MNKAVKIRTPNKAPALGSLTCEVNLSIRLNCLLSAYDDNFLLTDLHNDLVCIVDYVVYIVLFSIQSGEPYPISITVHYSRNIC
jgi:hypothetical protein